jgi:hypothetical protein
VNQKMVARIMGEKALDRLAPCAPIAVLLPKDHCRSLQRRFWTSCSTASIISKVPSKIALSALIVRAARTKYVSLRLWPRTRTALTETMMERTLKRMISKIVYMSISEGSEED